MCMLILLFSIVGIIVGIMFFFLMVEVFIILAGGLTITLLWSTDNFLYQVLAVILAVIILVILRRYEE